MEIVRLNKPPISGAGSQSLTSANVLSNVFIELLIRLAPGQSLLRSHADGVVFAYEIEHLIDGAVQGQLILVHEEQDQVLKLRDPLLWW